MVSTVDQHVSRRVRRHVNVAARVTHRRRFWTILKVTDVMSPTAKVTYISLSADDPALDAAFDAAIADVRAALGRDYPLHVAGETRAGARADREPQPRRTRAWSSRASPPRPQTDVRDAVAAAHAAFPRWSARPLAGARGDPRPRRRHRARSAASSWRPG